MPTYLTEDRSRLRERLRDVLDQAQTENGEAAFPEQDVPGTAGYTLREVYVRILEQHNQQLNNAIEDFSPRTARGAALDEWARFFGMERSASQNATGTVLLKSEVTGDTLEQLTDTRRIPQGTRLRGTGLTLETNEEVRIPLQEKSVEATVEVVTGGANAEVNVGAAFDVVGRQMLEAEVTETVQGGQSAETDDQLRYRLTRAMRAPSTFEGLEAQILAHPEVDDISIRAGAYGPGTAEVLVYPAVSIPTESLRQELEQAAQEGPGQVYVLFPSYEGLKLKIEVTSQPDSAPQAVSDLIVNIDAGGSLVLNDVEQRVRDQGAADAQVLTIKRGPVGDNKELIRPKTLRQPTNLQPRDEQTRWYTRPDWITICQ
jgi:hypothetical protein